MRVKISILHLARCMTEPVDFYRGPGGLSSKLSLFQNFSSQFFTQKVALMTRWRLDPRSPQHNVSYNSNMLY